MRAPEEIEHGKEKRIQNPEFRRKEEEKFATESTEDTEKLRFNCHEKAQKAQKEKVVSCEEDRRKNPEFRRN